MTRTPVKSSAVLSVGYDNGTLEVEYAGGRVYQLAGISQDQYDALLTADSIGRAVNSLKAFCASCTRVEDHDDAE